MLIMSSWSPHGVVANKPDFDIIVSELELQLYNNFTFKLKQLGEAWTLLSYSYGFH